MQAVLGTLAAFAAMLFLYGTRIIKVTGRFKKMMTIAMLAYLGIAPCQPGRSALRSG